jgi:5-methylthioadenosine/S-adenosylhomocysteine deaminase
MGMASCAELIHGGSTTAVVIYTYLDEYAKAAETVGNRVILGSDIEEFDLNKRVSGIYEHIPERGDAAFSRALDLYNKWEGKGDGRITTIMSPKAPDMTTPEMYLKCKETAEKYGLRVTTHLSQSWQEVKYVKHEYNKTPPQLLYDIGVMDMHLSGAHCTYATEKDTQLIHETKMAIPHCRGITNPLVRWLDLGIPIGLGTDEVHHDMLQLLRQQIGGVRTRAVAIRGADEMLSKNPRTFRPTFYEILELATRKGAEMMGIEDEIGSLEPGKKADVITIDLTNPYLTPTMDPITSIIRYGTSEQIDTVIVDGQILKQNFRLTKINIRDVLLNAKIRADHIINNFFEDHPDLKKMWEKRLGYKRL